MNRLGDILVNARALTADAREKAVAQRSKGGVRFGTAVLEVGGVSEELLLRALAVQSQVPSASSRDLAEIRPDILRLMPPKLAGKLCAVPFARSGRSLSVAMRDPRDKPAVDEVSFLTGLSVVPHVALELRLRLALEKHYGLPADPRFHALGEKLDRAAPAPAPASPKGAPSRPAAAAAATPPPPPVYTPPVVTYRPPPPPPPPAVMGPAAAEVVTPAGVESLEDPWGGEAPVPGLAEPELVFETLVVSAVTVSEEAPAPPSPSPAEEAAPPPAAPAVQVAPEVDTRTPPTGFVPAPAAEEAEPEAEEAEPEPEPPASLDLVTRLGSAESRDDIAEAVLESVTALHPRAALFIVQATEVLGWAAMPEPPEGLRSFALPLSEASVFATLRNTEGFYAGPCPDLPGNRKTLDALGAPWPATIAVVPVTLKGKTVLFLLAQAAEGASVPEVAPLKRLATMTATALEIVLLRNRLRNL